MNWLNITVDSLFVLVEATTRDASRQIRVLRLDARYGFPVRWVVDDVHNAYGRYLTDQGLWGRGRSIFTARPPMRIPLVAPPHWELTSATSQGLGDTRNLHGTLIDQRQTVRRCQLSNSIGDTSHLIPWDEYCLIRRVAAPAREREWAGNMSLVGWRPSGKIANFMQDSLTARPVRVAGY